MWADPAIGGHDGHEVPPLDLLCAYLDGPAPALTQGQRHEDDDHERDTYPDEDLLTLAHRYSPEGSCRGRPTAASRAVSAWWNE